MNNIKTKFHLAKRPGGRFGASSGSAAGHTQSVALVDERYLSWLATQQAGSSATVSLQRGALTSVFGHLARVALPDTQLIRTCHIPDLLFR